MELLKNMTISYYIRKILIKQALKNLSSSAQSPHYPLHFLPSSESESHSHSFSTPSPLLPSSPLPFSPLLDLSVFHFFLTGIVASLLNGNKWIEQQ